MRHLTCLTFVFSCMLWSNSLALAADDDKKTPPEVGDDWIVVEEDVWYVLVEEPDRFLEQAKARFDKGDSAGAAKEINKAVGILKLETAAPSWA